jgi:hypothetical protein
VPVSKLYACVRPSRILERVRDQAPGSPITTVANLHTWLQANGAAHGRQVTATFVVDEAGQLRVADRHAEHVACANGQPVRSAGEMTFVVVGSDVRVTAVSNESTGFCPEPASWPEIQRALDALGIAHPGGFTLSAARSPLLS